MKIQAFLRFTFLAACPALLFSGCATTSDGGSRFDASRIDVARIAGTGSRLATSLILANNPGRDDQVLEVADAVTGVFVDQTLTDELIGDLALRLAVRLGLDPAQAALTKGAIMEMWGAIKPAFGDAPIVATDPRVKAAVDAFAAGMRAAVDDFRTARALATR